MSISKEQQLANVLTYQRQELKKITPPDISVAEARIAESTALLQALGYNPVPEIAKQELIAPPRKEYIIPSWEELCRQAEAAVGKNNPIEALFTPEELKSREAALIQLNEEFNALHRLDALDMAICAAAALLGGLVDILLVGIPHKTASGLKGGPLANYVRDWFDKKYPEAAMEELANSKVSKVPYDAQDNRNTTVYVDGLSAYYHRLLSLGHDPFLGLLFGVADILNGQMTTIDKQGRLVRQAIAEYEERRESSVFAALAKQIIHFKSDITTSMGLPAPMMALFNFCQFGSIGEEEQTVAEIAQGMYYEGYDFIHFCTLSIPVMLVETTTRIGYAIKRIKEGVPLQKALPFSLERRQNPKLATMLFLAHAAASAINSGKICFSNNPLAINYPEWLAFGIYSYKELKWALVEKPLLRQDYILGQLDAEWNAIDARLDASLNKHKLVFGG